MPAVRSRPKRALFVRQAGAIWDDDERLEFVRFIAARRGGLAGENASRRIVVGDDAGIAAVEAQRQKVGLLARWCPRPDSNRHAREGNRF